MPTVVGTSADTSPASGYHFRLPPPEIVLRIIQLGAECLHAVPFPGVRVQSGQNFLLACSHV